MRCGNLGVLDTLDSKLQIPANFLSSCSSRTFKQLESGTWHFELLDPNVQLELDPGSMTSSRSFPGACCTPPHSPASY